MEESQKKIITNTGGARQKSNSKKGGGNFSPNQLPNMRLFLPNNFLVILFLSYRDFNLNLFVNLSVPPLVINSKDQKTDIQ